jgi:plastocyanin
MLAVAVAFPVIASANENDDQDGKKPRAVKDAFVEFGQPQPQSDVPAETHVLLPDDVTIFRGGTVTFVVNGGGHGIGIYPVSRNTTRDGIAAQLCQGGPTVCNSDAGTHNVNYEIEDGRGNVIIVTGTNVQFARVDDPTNRLLSTSGQFVNAGGMTVVGAFLVGTGTTPTGMGNHIQVRLTRPGRYLVVCQNRNHYLNNHMFGFVNVVNDDGKDDDDRGGHGGHD